MRRMSFAYGRERSLPLVFGGIRMSDQRTKEISVFVDESGSFESDEESSRFYLVCFVLHDQSADISEWVGNLEDYLDARGLGREHCVHVGPLIRREGEYAQMQREERQGIFNKMMAFVRKADIAYRCFAVDKHFEDADTAVHDKLLQSINRFLVEHAEMFNLYEKLKVYYDNGQAQMKNVLEEAFAMYSSIVEFVPSVKPESYRLFQVADLLCSVTLVELKSCKGIGLSSSEDKFFGSLRDFKRNVLKKLKAKEI